MVGGRCNRVIYVTFPRGAGVRDKADLRGVRVSDRVGEAPMPTGGDSMPAAMAVRQAPLFAAFDPARAPVASFVVPALLVFATVLAGRGLLLPGVGLSVCWLSVGFAFLFSLGHQSCALPRRTRRATLWIFTLLASQAAGHAAAWLVWPEASPPWAVLALWIAGDTAQALFAACLFKRLRRERPLWGLDSLHTNVSLLAAGAASSVLGAAVVAASIALAGALPWTALPFLLLRNTLVVYGFCAAVLLFSVPPDPHDVPRRDWRLTLAVGGGLLGDLLFVWASGPQYTFAFVVVPVVMWAASVLSVRQTALFLQIVMLPVLVSSMVGAGPFAAGQPGIRVATTYGLVLFVSVMAMMITLETLERRRLLARVQAQARQSAEQARLLGTILDALPEAVVVVDAQGEVASQNVASRYLWEAGPHLVELTGSGGHRPVREALGGDEVAGVDVVIEPRVVVPEPLGLGSAAARADRIVSVQAYPLRFKDDPAAVVIAADVTEQRRRTDELRSFAQVVAHDLLNPLAASDLWRESLQEELAAIRPGLGATALTELGAANDRMRRFITDLHHYTVARDGSPEWGEVELFDVLEDVLADRLKAIPCDERPDVEVSVHGRVRGDHALLRQLFMNLIENAYKYRRPGTRGRIRVWAQSPHPAWRVVHVDDDGIGIPIGQERRIFQEFYRAENGEAVRGSGLGLAICERIVARHGGRIEARVRGERGSRFTVWLPSLAASELPSCPSVAHGPMIEAGLARTQTQTEVPAAPRAEERVAIGEGSPEMEAQEAVSAGPGGGVALP